MITRVLQQQLIETLNSTPAVALLGPRQVGKTTLALTVAEQYQAIYLDLESEQDRAKLAQAELYLSDHQNKLVILDEIHRVPALFPVLRGLIDKNRRAGRNNRQYLLLGSASPELLKQSGETLAGRIAYLELTPFTILETGTSALDALWIRGGFPESFLADTLSNSVRWRKNFLRTYLEHDIPQFGPRIAAETLRRFWVMVAYNQGGLLNSSQFARNLGMDVKTINNYLDLLVDLFLLRRLPAWHNNSGKRLIKTPKVYVRDSGLLHTLLSLQDKENLLAHPIVGQSWDGFVVEQLLSSVTDKAEAYFYRTANGAEIDLLLQQADGSLWAIEIKRSLAPKLEKGFYNACADLQPARKYVVYAGTERYRLADDIEAIPLADLAKLLSEQL